MNMQFGLDALAGIQKEAQRQAEQAASRASSDKFRYTFFAKGESKLVRFLMPGPGTYWEHSLYNGKHSSDISCTAKDPTNPQPGECGVCDAFPKDRDVNPIQKGFIAMRVLSPSLPDKNGKTWTNDQNISIWRQISGTVLKTMATVLETQKDFRVFPYQVTRILDEGNKSKNYNFMPFVTGENAATAHILDETDQRLMAELGNIDWDKEMSFGTPTESQVSDFIAAVHKYKSAQEAKQGTTLGTTTDLSQTATPTQNPYVGMPAALPGQPLAPAYSPPQATYPSTGTPVPPGPDQGPPPWPAAASTEPAPYTVPAGLMAAPVGVPQYQDPPATQPASKFQ